jgi:hypothetical protein
MWGGVFRPRLTARLRISTQVVLPDAIGRQRSDRGLLRRRQQAIDLEAAILGAGALRSASAMSDVALAVSPRLPST